MTFQKYNSSNNAIAQLDLPITEISSTLTLKGSYDRLPTTNFIVTVTERNITDDVIFRENMLISSRSGSVCNIQTRKFEPVPQTDTSLTNVQESYAFSSDSIVECTDSSYFSKDIQDEVTRLETDKLDKGALRTGLASAWKFFFSNGSNNETELGFGPSGSYLKSTGAGGIPIWDNPPLDINGQTTTTAPTNSWLVPVFSGASNFKTTIANFTKGLSQATTSVFGVVQRATDSEGDARTNNTKYITPLQSYVVVAGTKLLANMGDVEVTKTTSYTKIKEISLPKGGVYSTEFQIVKSGSGTGNAQLYVNGSPAGILRTFTSIQTYTENITVPNGGLLQLYVKSSETVSGVQTNYLKVLYSTDPIVPFTINNN